MMRYEEIVHKITQEDGVEESTMMKSPCLRFEGNFIAMMFNKEDALIIKVSPERVDEIIAQGKGREFTFTKKRFKEWVLIPLDFEADYQGFVYEALAYAAKS